MIAILVANITFRNRLISLYPVILVRPELLALVMGLTDQTLDGVIAEADGFHVGHGGLGGPVVLEVGREVVVVRLFPLAPALVRLHEPALGQLRIGLPTILEKNPQL